ncbi:cytochrome c oxidase assembly protein [Aquicella lusitana]|uniref:Cytochrome c oxidase assembly protein CtaG n=1 Tax=Aquicella lusitana TaxID=254246 RepID=A0A370GKH9_9COXI|nr:cytochrome c oxidase assembly protein [Aquicella lusitana]RDI42443.1 cytochrome c oxidase assembly protein subunit 11 [Aquicella lusitana]VVC74095.1 Cytochrome c oxidase assembly protein CtaG [Aquicella lusitana]
MVEKKSHRKIFIIGGIVAVLMFGFCFAMVPLYTLICKKTGINTTSVAGTELTKPSVAAALGKNIDMSREITVQFTATNHMGMPWDFYPRTKSVKVHPGEKVQVYFYAKNPTEKNMTAQAIPAMTPTEAISHFHKIECFCFNQQKLKAGESREMGLLFQIDKDLPKETQVITLAYTLFDATPNEASKG